jgi:hypothetical protein
MPRDKKFKKRWWLGLFGGSALWLAIFAHVFFALVATYIVVEHFQKKHINFQATAPPAPHVDVEHKVELSKKNNVESAPPDLKRIVTTDISPITLPDVPETPQTEDTTPTTMAGEGDVGEGTGGGNGPGGAGSGSPDFGLPNGVGLKGYFYDLKQTPDHQSTSMDERGMLSTVGDFCRQGWNEDDLATHFLKSPKPLFANQILVPITDSEEGPKAFGMGDVCRPGYWVAIYHATVLSNLSGNYRVAGYGDDFLIVRINGDTVLDSGWYPPVTSAKPTHIYEPTWASPDFQQWKNWDKKTPYDGTVAGDSFRLNGFDPVTIDVLIGDCKPEGTGKCGYHIFLVEDGKDYDKDPTGFPIFPLLQIQPDTKVKRDGIYPPFSCKAEDAMIQPQP